MENLSIEENRTTTSSARMKSLSSLQIELLNAARSIKKLKALCDYVFSRLYEFIQMDSASLNLCVIEDNMMLSELQCYFYKQPEKMASSYEKSTQVDFFTPIVIGLPRTVFHARGLISEGQYYETDLFKMHCCHFDVHNGIAVGAKIPGHKHKFIILYLYAGEAKRMFTQNEMRFLDGIFPVFFSTLIYRLGFICEETLIEQVSLLNKFSSSPELMKVIKKVIEKPQARRWEYAQELGKSTSTLNMQFQTIFEKLGLRNEENNQNNWNMKMQIIENFSFLKH